MNRMSRMRRTVVYISHPLSGDFERNIHKAGLWYGFCRRLSHDGIMWLLNGANHLDSPHMKMVTEYRKVIDETGIPKESHFMIGKPFDRDRLPVFLAPWLTCPVADGAYPGGRPKAMDDGITVVARCADELWHFGPTISPGMAEEASHARMVRDLTSWGENPPTWADSKLFLS